MMEEPSLAIDKGHHLKTTQLHASGPYSGCRIGIGGVKSKENRHIMDWYKTVGPTSQELCTLNFILRNVGPSCCIIVPIHNVSCFFCFLLQQCQSYIPLYFSKRNCFIYLFHCFFLYHAEGLVRWHLGRLTLVLKNLKKYHKRSFCWTVIH